MGRLVFDAGDPTIAVAASGSPLTTWTTLIALRMTPGWPALVHEFSIGGNSITPSHGGGQARVLVVDESATDAGGTAITKVQNLMGGPTTFNAANYPQFVVADCLQGPTMTFAAADVVCIFPAVVVPPQVVPIVRGPREGEQWQVPLFSGAGGYWILYQARFVEAQAVLATITVEPA